LDTSSIQSLGILYLYPDYYNFSCTSSRWKRAGLPML